MNFTYDVKLSKDGSWGSKKADGTWGGMIEEVYRQEKEIGMSQKLTI